MYLERRCSRRRQEENFYPRMINGRSLSSRSKRVGKHGPMRRNSHPANPTPLFLTHALWNAHFLSQLFSILFFVLTKSFRHPSDPSTPPSFSRMFTICSTICIAYLGCRPGVDRSGSSGPWGPSSWASC
ncbi:hypothetical protein BO94DRAFT_125509 [Aspergillus sclerotioniger CBS 115572]|uniref:Uncharacterized protein n=1 Tax=Aspergillus sclerotioniger CBS 115572 TaxID=1450535 RepID=A0A317XFE0_9EURO|nr:hypothetical protein BO94DRAFT_125509 [Aspergillus sclerotioniger CBS 115572]PWY95450.1 hypothetical protein BO94DRAFT_125509 [Aspergillus sclerotioniger CBS 115572]